MLGVYIVYDAEKDVKLPLSADDGASGVDLHAYLPDGVIILLPNTSKLIPTGLRVAIPEGYELQIRPRSGLALNHNITVLNSPGTIDSSYRGEIKVILMNHGQGTFQISNNMRIAQAVCAPVCKILWQNISLNEFDELKTDRGSGGFGSSGL